MTKGVKTSVVDHKEVTSLRCHLSCLSQNFRKCDNVVEFYVVY